MPGCEQVADGVTELTPINGPRGVSTSFASVVLAPWASVTSTDAGRTFPPLGTVIVTSCG